MAIGCKDAAGEADADKFQAKLSKWYSPPGLQDQRINRGDTRASLGETPVQASRKKSSDKANTSIKLCLWLQATASYLPYRPVKRIERANLFNTQKRLFCLFSRFNCDYFRVFALD